MAYIGTTDLLDADATYTSQVVLSDRADYISGAVFADQTGTVYIEQSGDGENWDISTDYTVDISTGKNFSEALLLPFIRVRFVNDSDDQGAFRVFARFTSAGDS